MTAIPSTAKLHKKKKYTWNNYKYLLIAIPFLVYVFAFSYVPLCGWVYAFFKYKMGWTFLDPSKLTAENWLGLSNFTRIFTTGGADFLRVMRNTMVMSLLGLCFSPLPVIFAILLNEVRVNWFKKIVQTGTTLPNFISWIIVYGLAFAMFSNNGALYKLLDVIHYDDFLALFGKQRSKLSLLGNVDYAWSFQLLLGIWKSLGWSAVIYIAAIAGIDAELYDAAKIDGANRFQTVMNVTVPGIVPTYTVLLLLSVSNLLSNGFDQYFMFMNSMISKKVEVLDYYVYKIGLIFNDYSYSIAIGMSKSLVSIVLLFFANFIAKQVRGETIL